MQTMPLLLATVATLQAHPVRPAAPVPLAAPALAQLDPGMAALPELLVQQDPGDSLYRAARQALNRNDYRRAAELFRQLRARFPASTHTPDAYYWEAFALYRTGADEALRAARTALQEQAQRHRDAATYRDAEVLLRRVQGELARRGDAEAAARIAEEAAQAAARPEDGAQPARPARPPRPPRPGRPAECDDEDDIRLAALNALLQMDEERAVPILQTVLAKRDEGSICLRRKAVFLLSQKRTGETEDILLDAARRDPDLEVRRQAVFWLSQVGTDKAAAALDSILRHATDAELQEKAVFALSQHRSPRAGPRTGFGSPQGGVRGAPRRHSLGSLPPVHGKPLELRAAGRREPDRKPRPDLSRPGAGDRKARGEKALARDWLPPGCLSQSSRHQGACPGRPIARLSLARADNF